MHLDYRGATFYVRPPCAQPGLPLCPHLHAPREREPLPRLPALPHSQTDRWHCRCTQVLLPRELATAAVRQSLRHLGHVRMLPQLPPGLLKHARQLPPEYPPLRQPRLCYKVVARTGGRYLSVYDGVTEYKIGATLQQPARPGHRGGFVDPRPSPQPRGPPATLFC